MRYTDNDILQLIRDGYRESGMRPITDAFLADGGCCGGVAAAWGAGHADAPCYEPSVIAVAIGRSISWVFGFMAAWDNKAVTDAHPDFIRGSKCGLAARREHLGA